MLKYGTFVLQVEAGTMMRVGRGTYIAFMHTSLFEMRATGSGGRSVQISQGQAPADKGHRCEWQANGRS